MTTTNLISTPNITGNIGSCEVKSITTAVSSFYNQVIVSNSCTGEIITNATYFDYMGLGFGALIGCCVLSILFFVLIYIELK